MKRKKIKKVDGSKRGASQSIKQAKTKKAQDFTGQNIDKDTAMRGMKIEDSKVWQKTIAFSVIAVLGTFLIILGIQDNIITIEGNGIKLTCSFVGILFVVGAIIGLIRNNPKINIINDK